MGPSGADLRGYVGGKRFINAYSIAADKFARVFVTKVSLFGRFISMQKLGATSEKKPSVTAPSFVTMNSGCRLVHSLEPISQRLRSYLWNFRPGQSMHEFLLHSRFPAHSALCEFTFGTNKSALVCQCGVDSIPPDFRAQVCKYLIANVSYKCSWSYFWENPLMMPSLFSLISRKYIVCLILFSYSQSNNTHSILLQCCCNELK